MIPYITQLLDSFNQIGPYEGQFMPGVNMWLEEAKCRISGSSSPDEWHVLNYEAIKPEIEKLLQLSSITLQFYSPLRLPRPETEKEIGHRFCDSSYFDENPKSSVSHILSRLRIPPSDEQFSANLEITSTNIHWIDIAYGKVEKKTIGGVIGRIKLQGQLSRDTALLLTLGQYVGVRKNPAFGFGYYVIPDIISDTSIAHIKRGKSIFERAFNIFQLKESLMKLPNSSPGPDGVTVEDIKKAGDEILLKIQDNS